MPVYNFNSNFKDGPLQLPRQPICIVCGIQLGNLNQKLAAMRDKLRDDIAQDLQYMHLKMNVKSGRDSEASASNPSAATSSSIFLSMQLEMRKIISINLATILSTICRKMLLKTIETHLKHPNIT
jgi:hypothetical protein